jgi:hypothetical protein
MATFSLVSGLIGWIIILVTLCANIMIALLSIATLGLGSVLGICTTAVGFISPLAWLIGIITGHIAKGQIRNTGEAGGGSATAGLIMSYIGLGLLITSICVITILSLAGVAITIPFFTDPSFYQ